MSKVCIIIVPTWGVCFRMYDVYDRLEGKLLDEEVEEVCVPPAPADVLL